MSPDDSPNEPTIGPYPIVRKLGEGGMGVVYLVRDPTAAGREVALKLHRDESGDPRLVERFMREAKILASLNHPGIVKVHTTGWLNQGPFLLMEFIEGQPLDEKVREPMDPQEAARITRGVADAVATLHVNGLLHRDIKPSNVLLRPDGSPVLLDFGLARDMRADRLTQTGEVLGTPCYMSPEQADGGSPDAYGPPVDVYGLAALLFHLLTARAPYVGSPVRIIIDILEAPPPPPSKLEKGVPKALDAIVQKATRHEPSARYEDAAAMREDLDRFLRGKDPVALEEFRPPGRRKKIAAALFVLVLALASGGAWAYTQRSKPPTEPIALSFAAPEFRGSVRATILPETQGQVVVVGAVRTEGPWAEVSLGDHGTPLRLEGGGAFELAATVSPLTTGLSVRLRGPGGEAEPKWVTVTKAWPGWFRKLDAELRPPTPLPKGLVAVEGTTGDYLWKADGSVLRWIPPGEFVMGKTNKELVDVSLLARDKKQEDLREQRGAQSVKAKLSQGVFLGKYELTWEQWNRFCEVTKRRRPNRSYRREPAAKRANMQGRKWKVVKPSVQVPSTHPATQFTQDQALEYCERYGLRLPTEAEWERAARGGSSTKVYVWGEDFLGGAASSLAADGHRFTSPVGEFDKDRTGYGCYDMAGNVSERVAGFFHPYPSDGFWEPHGERGELDAYTVRGGNWALDIAGVFACSYRSTCDRTKSNAQVGMRVALSPRGQGK